MSKLQLPKMSDGFAGWICCFGIETLKIKFSPKNAQDHLRIGSQCTAATSLQQNSMRMMVVDSFQRA